jgi:hypothetical protein
MTLSMFWFYDHLLYIYIYNLHAKMYFTTFPIYGIFVYEASDVTPTYRILGKKTGDTIRQTSEFTFNSPLTVNTFSPVSI